MLGPRAIKLITDGNVQRLTSLPLIASSVNLTYIADSDPTSVCLLYGATAPPDSGAMTADVCHQILSGNQKNYGLPHYSSDSLYLDTWFVKAPAGTVYIEYLAKY